MSGSRTTIGLDVGGTKVAAVLLERAGGTVLDREQASSGGSATDLVATLAGLVDSLAHRWTLKTMILTQRGQGRLGTL